MKRNILTSIFLSFLLLGCGNNEVSENTTPNGETHQNQKVDFNALNLESMGIAQGILENEKTRPILSPSVISAFITQGVGDYKPETEPLVAYIKRNNEQTKTLIDNFRTENSEHTKRQIDTRIKISQEINTRLNKLYAIITNYSSELKSLNKKLLEYDFKLKERISVWTFVSKENNIEEKMEKIITDILQEEYSLENKLKFLFDSWLNKNTKNKLDVYFNIHQDFKTAYDNLKNVDLIIKTKYPNDYEYAENYLKKIKAKKI